MPVRMTSKMFGSRNSIRGDTRARTFCVVDKVDEADILIVDETLLIGAVDSCIGLDCKS